MVRVQVWGDDKYYRKGDDECKGRRANSRMATRMGEDGNEELGRSTLIVRVFPRTRVGAWTVLLRKRENGHEGQAG